MMPPSDFSSLSGNSPLSRVSIMEKMLPKVDDVFWNHSKEIGRYILLRDIQSERIEAIPNNTDRQKDDNSYRNQVSLHSKFGENCGKECDKELPR
jgi:hypothetical protein